MTPALERRKENISMEVALGKLQGQLEGILSSQSRMERSLEEVSRTLHARIDALHDSKQEDGEVKIPWKLFLLLLAASGGGAGIKHLLEMVGQ